MFKRKVSEQGASLFSGQVTTLKSKFDNIYNGEFKNKKRHGKGTLKTAFGNEVHTGIWKKNKLQGEATVSMQGNADSPMKIYFKKNKVDRKKHQTKPEVRFIPKGTPDKHLQYHLNRSPSCATRGANLIYRNLAYFSKKGEPSKYY